MKHLVIGGVRSGKSAYAQKLTADIAEKNVTVSKSLTYQQEQENIIYLATAQALDSGMEERVKKHQQNRPTSWQVIEEPLNIAAVLSAPENQNATILIECMTLWLTNVMFSEEDASNESNIENTDKFVTTFLTALKTTQANVIIVTSEVGLGVMPMNALARQFADQAGELNQTLAQLCDQVTLVTAGLPLALK